MFQKWLYVCNSVYLFASKQKIWRSKNWNLKENNFQNYNQLYKFKVPQLLFRQKCERQSPKIYVSNILFFLSFYIFFWFAKKKILIEIFRA